MYILLKIALEREYIGKKIASKEIRWRAESENSNE